MKRVPFEMEESESKEVNNEVGISTTTSTLILFWIR